MNRLKKYVLLLSHLILAITYVHCDGEVFILGKPVSMRLEEREQILSSDVFESFQHLLGYEYPGVKQMEMTNVFDFEKFKVILMLVDDSTPNIDSSNAIKKYLMKEDMSLDDILIELQKLTLRGNTFGLKITIESFADKQKFDTNDNGPQVIWADMRSMSYDEITKTVADLMKLVEGSSNVLKIVMSSDGKTSVPYDREKRETVAENSNTPKKEVIDAKTLNLAEDYDENFPVIFNIMLWFSMALIFALIAICMVIANMDPGRDSIIYRMTSTRMKKDN